MGHAYKNVLEINSELGLVGLKIMELDWFHFDIESHNFESNSAEHQVDLKNVL